MSKLGAGGENVNCVPPQCESQEEGTYPKSRHGRLLMAHTLKFEKFKNILQLHTPHVY